MVKKAGIFVLGGLAVGTAAAVLLTRKSEAAPPENQVFGVPTCYAERCILSNFWDTSVFSCAVRNPYADTLTINVSLMRLEEYSDGRVKGPDVLAKETFVINPGDTMLFEYHGKNDMASCGPNINKDCVTSFWLKDTKGNESPVATIEQ